MKRALFLPLLSVVSLSAGLVGLRADGTAPSSENLSFEQLDDFRNEHKFSEIIAALQPEDLTSKAGDLGKDVDQLYSLRAFAYRSLKKGGEAEADYKRALADCQDEGQNSLYWFGLAENYRLNLSDPAAALSAYQKTIGLCFQRQYTTGWLPIQASLCAADILCAESKFDEALTVLEPYDALMSRIPSVWQIKLLKTFAEVYNGLGKEDEANARLQKAQALEENPSSTP